MDWTKSLFQELIVILIITCNGICHCLQRKNEKCTKGNIITSHAINTELIDVASWWWGPLPFTLAILFPPETFNHNNTLSWLYLQIQHVGSSIKHLQSFLEKIFTQPWQILNQYFSYLYYGFTLFFSSLCIIFY